MGRRADDRCFMLTTPTREKSVITTRSTIFGFFLATLAACLTCATVAASPIIGTYTANSLGRSDDSSVGPVSLGFTMNFFGRSWTSVYVNNNGNVTFGSPNSIYTPTGLNGVLASAIIAPFYADVDTRPSKSGIVTYAAVASGVGGHPTFGVEWPKVDYYVDGNGNTQTVQDTFELLIVSRSDLGAGNFDMYFNYGSMKWETGSASGGVNGLGGTCATAGFSAGAGAAGGYFQLAGSGVCGKLIDGGSNQLVTATNDGVAGQWMFFFRDGTFVTAAVAEPPAILAFCTGLAGICLIRPARRSLARRHATRRRDVWIKPVPLLIRLVILITVMSIRQAGAEPVTDPGATATAKTPPAPQPNAAIPQQPAFAPHKRSWIFYHAGDAAAASPDGLVGIVEGRNIRIEDVGDAIDALPEQIRDTPLDTLYPMILEMLVNQTVLIEQASRLGLENDPSVRRHMETAAKMALGKEVLDRIVADRLDDAALEARYEKHFSGKPGIEEARARIITMKSYDEAMEVISALDKGGDFKGIARAKSVDPSARAGGDLGYLRRDLLHPSQADAVFELPAGAHSRRPVRDRKGWSVVRVDDRRLKPIPPLDQARAFLRQELMREIINEELTRIRADLHIRQFNLDGSPLEVNETAASWHIVAIPK